MRAREMCAQSVYTQNRGGIIFFWRNFIFHFQWPLFNINVYTINHFFSLSNFKQMCSSHLKLLSQSSPMCPLRVQLLEKMDSLTATAHVSMTTKHKRGLVSFGGTSYIKFLNMYKCNIYKAPFHHYSSLNMTFKVNCFDINFIRHV